MKLRSKITSKFQITIPKEVRDTLKLGMADVLEWHVDKKGVHVEAAEKPFLKHMGTLDVDSADVRGDIRKAWKLRAERYKK